MGLRAESTEGHACGVEAQQDVLQRLNLFHINGVHIVAQGKEIPKGRHRALVDQLGVFLVGVVVTVLGSPVQGIDHVRVEGVIFLAMDVLENAAGIDGLALLPGILGQALLVGFEILEAGALDTAWHTAEAQVHHITGDPHRFKQLGTTIGGDGGNPHLGEDLHQALVDALAEILLQFHRIAEQLAGTHHVGDHVVGQVRVNGSSTETEQHREVMGITGSGRFHNNVGVRTQTFFGQVMMHCTGGHQRMDSQLILGDTVIGEYQDHLAIADRLGGLLAKIFHRLTQTNLRIVMQAQLAHIVSGTIDLHQVGELGM